MSRNQHPVARDELCHGCTPTVGEQRVTEPRSRHRPAVEGFPAGWWWWQRILVHQVSHALPPPGLRPPISRERRACVHFEEHGRARLSSDLWAAPLTSNGMGPMVTIPAHSPESTALATEPGEPGTWLWQSWSKPLFSDPSQGPPQGRAGTAGLSELPRRPVWAFSQVTVRQVPPAPTRCRDYGAGGLGWAA